MKLSGLRWRHGAAPRKRENRISPSVGEGVEQLG
jgi:hypothetical protein